MKKFLFGCVLGAIGAIGILIAAIFVFGEEEGIDETGLIGARYR